MKFGSQHARVRRAQISQPLKRPPQCSLNNHLSPAHIGDARPVEHNPQLCDLVVRNQRRSGSRRNGRIGGRTKQSFVRHLRILRRIGVAADAEEVRHELLNVIDVADTDC